MLHDDDRDVYIISIRLQGRSRRADQKCPTFPRCRSKWFKNVYIYTFDWHLSSRPGHAVVKMIWKRAVRVVRAVCSVCAYTRPHKSKSHNNNLLSPRRRSHKGTIYNKIYIIYITHNNVCRRSRCRRQRYFSCLRELANAHVYVPVYVPTYNMYIIIYNNVYNIPTKNVNRGV